MYIDFEKLKRERKLDPFTCAPADIEESVALTGEVMRDDARTNPEVVKATGTAVCRVRVKAPSARLRQLLAVLGWMPLDPGDDDVWYLDEPVDLAACDNYLVSSFVAQYYAEGMNLLFAPDDGMFDGVACRYGVGPGATPHQLREEQKLMVERAYVTCAIRAPRVPATVLHKFAAAAIERVNTARVRCGLMPLSLPGRTVVGRWRSEFYLKHFDRPGVGRAWSDLRR